MGSERVLNGAWWQLIPSAPRKGGSTDDMLTVEVIRLWPKPEETHSQIPDHLYADPVILWGTPKRAMKANPMTWITALLQGEAGWGARIRT